MLVRHALVAVLVSAGLVPFAGEAGAQSGPQPYSYPPGGYRGVPDQDGVMTLDPNMDERRSRSPYGRLNPYDQGAPYPYDPRLPREVRMPDEAQTSAPASDPYPIPNYNDPADPAPGAAAPRGPFGHYGDRTPIDTPASLQPPATIGPVPPQAVPGAQPAPTRPNTVAALPPEDQPEEGEPKELPPQFKRQTVQYQSKQPAGTIIIDTASTYLYLVQGDGTAIRYGIGVGREGFTWAGTEKITKLAEWPDWHPPAEMIERQPYLPRFMAGGPGNPLGARALYLGKTIYRIHGTNQPSTIGKFVSSGCIRMLNEDVEDLYSRVKVGTRVVVLPGGPPSSASNLAAPISR
ncbi:MAG: L,D-transpeptidase [Pseudorhodoplanes sp.]|nr:hypothetical protein [Pseudorhodoplanes sp.]MBW7950824.1 L,D-transpeptidase [Pseudorhodoplanes sp.]MCL4710223.1 L,D-transpeptidase [Pseudorhodoplanes sp.]MCQ3943251.1 L,D-transpeptidase [Alphaproteobacteria bacterium]GIK79916.1 MAG: L,D-transpeptidase [Alphaproteobacteria bacterium]